MSNPNQPIASEINAGHPIAETEAAQIAQTVESLEQIKATQESEKDSDLRTTDGYTLDKAGRLDNKAVQPPVYQQSEPKFGFTPTAEIWNGRAAMVGFAILLLIEFLSHQGFLHFWNLI